MLSLTPLIKFLLELEAAVSHLAALPVLEEKLNKLEQQGLHLPDDVKKDLITQVSKEVSMALKDVLEQESQQVVSLVQDLIGPIFQLVSDLRGSVGKLTEQVVELNKKLEIELDPAEVEAEVKAKFDALEAQLKGVISPPAPAPAAPAPEVPAPAPVAPVSEAPAAPASDAPASAPATPAQ
jgi:hypothetical protein